MKSFGLPDELREFTLQVADRLESAGLGDAAAILRDGANFPATTGWEWLGELALAVERIRGRFDVSPALYDELRAILKTAKSRRPYRT